jgi:FlaA1/EpsC-like NDP-sugar epimerase
MMVHARLIRLAKIALDAAVFAGVFCAAFFIRFEGSVPPVMVAIMLASLPVLLAVKLLSFFAFRVPQLAWRSVSMLELHRIFFALAGASALLVSMRLAAASLRDTIPLAGYFQPPLGVLLIDFALSLLGTLGARVVWRLWVEHGLYVLLDVPNTRKIASLLVSGTRTARQVARQIAMRPDLRILPLGFLDPDPSRVGIVIHGIPVVGSVARAAKVIRDLGAEQVLIASPATPGDVVRQVVEAARTCGVPVRVVPAVSDIGGEVKLARVREVAIEDILGREPVRLNSDAVPRLVERQTVLLTGAGGSIGSELCRAVSRFDPARLILLERAENNLFHIHRRLAEEFPMVELVPCIADICDTTRVGHLLARYRPSVVFHAAAHKHVPLMEWNAGEAVKNNVAGTRGLADLAHAHGVGEFVLLSTDKAVNPTSVMGVSKRVAELYIQALSQRSRTKFVAVRFGNVLGSVGSVVPIFQEQIRKGGPVTVTHPEMTRFFMTIPEACQLVLEAAALGKGGEVFILDMGRPVKILDLAHDLIRLSGLVPKKDVEVRFTGIRPGEKLFEELALQEESAEHTRHPRIFTGRVQPQDWETVGRLIEELTALANFPDAGRIRAKFKEIVPEYAYAGPCGAEVGPDAAEPVRNGTVPVAMASEPA